MGTLSYSCLTSLDGYVADQNGDIDWAVPDDELHGYINDLDRDAGTYLYGRRLYQAMTGWETLDSEPGQTELMIDFARIWQSADKIVYSTTLSEVPTARTRIERRFDPAQVRALKESVDHEILIGGATLAAQAIRAGLIDEYHLFVLPVIIGGGLPYLPDGATGSLELVDLRRFGSGAVHLHYRAG